VSAENRVGSVGTELWQCQTARGRKIELVAENNPEDGDVELYPPESAKKFHTIYWCSVSISSSLGWIGRGRIAFGCFWMMVDHVHKSPTFSIYILIIVISIISVGKYTASLVEIGPYTGQVCASGITDGPCHIEPSLVPLTPQIHVCIKEWITVWSFMAAIPENKGLIMVTWHQLLSLSCAVTVQCLYISIMIF
jgi:hypothetical protein